MRKTDIRKGILEFFKMPNRRSQLVKWIIERFYIWFMFALTVVTGFIYNPLALIVILITVFGFAVYIYERVAK